MKVLTTPHPFLRRTAKPVNGLTKSTINQIKDMITTLQAATDPEGVGLAATQVGINKRIFILLEDQIPQIFVNPKIIESSKKMITDVYKKPSRQWLEGCLSIPRIWGFVDRPYSVRVQYQTFDPHDQNPQLKTVTQTFEDIQSSYVQHETDHLNGILFTDHILKAGGTIYRETKSGLTPVELI